MKAEIKTPNVNKVAGESQKRSDNFCCSIPNENFNPPEKCVLHGVSFFAKLFAIIVVASVILTIPIASWRIAFAFSTSTAAK